MDGSEKIKFEATTKKDPNPLTEKRRVMQKGIWGYRKKHPGKGTQNEKNGPARLIEYSIVGA